MEKWLERFWRKPPGKHNEGVTSVEEKIEFSGEVDIKPFEINFEGISIETFKNSLDEIQGLTKIITENFELVCTLFENKPIGNLIFKNPKQENEINLNFNKNHELHGHCIVDKQELVFNNGKMVSIKYHPN